MSRNLATTNKGNGIYRVILPKGGITQHYLSPTTKVYLGRGGGGSGSCTPRREEGGGSTSVGTCSDDEDGDSSCSLEETAAKLEVALRRNLKLQNPHPHQNCVDDSDRTDVGQ